MDWPEPVRLSARLSCTVSSIFWWKLKGLMHVMTLFLWRHRAQHGETISAPSVNECENRLLKHCTVKVKHLSEVKLRKASFFFLPERHFERLTDNLIQFIRKWKTEQWVPDFCLRQIFKSLQGTFIELWQFKFNTGAHVGKILTSYQHQQTSANETRGYYSVFYNIFARLFQSAEMLRNALRHTIEMICCLSAWSIRCSLF